MSEFSPDDIAFSDVVGTGSHRSSSKKQPKSILKNNSSRYGHWNIFMNIHDILFNFYSQSFFGLQIGPIPGNSSVTKTCGFFLSTLPYNKCVFFGPRFYEVTLTAILCISVPCSKSKPISLLIN